MIWPVVLHVSAVYRGVVAVVAEIGGHLYCLFRTEISPGTRCGWFIPPDG